MHPLVYPISSGPRELKLVFYTMCGVPSRMHLSLLSVFEWFVLSRFASILSVFLSVFG